MKALIIGAGIGGMSTALALTRCGFDTEVFEAVKEIKPVGAAISIWPNGVKCLNSLGLREQIKALGAIWPGWPTVTFTAVMISPALAFPRWSLVLGSSPTQ